MRIGIEMNNIIRDINRQMVKYYKKDIVKDFDDENINYNRLWPNDIVELLKYIGELLRNTNNVTEQFAVTLPYSCIDDLGKIYAAMLTDNVNIDGKIVPLYDYYYYVSR